MSLYIFSVLSPSPRFFCCTNSSWLLHCTDPLCIDPSYVCHYIMRLYADVTVVEYSSFPFDILFTILHRSLSYLSDACWMNTIACIFSITHSLGFSLSVESAVSQLIFELFVILSSDIIVPSSNHLPTRYRIPSSLPLVCCLVKYPGISLVFRSYGTG